MKTSDIKYPILWKDNWLKTELESKTIREIAKEVGCKPSAINYVVRKLNITIPKRTSYKLIVDKSLISKEAYKRKYPNGRFGILSSNYKDGRVNNTKCIDCDKILSDWQKAKRCKSCARRFQYKDPTKHPNYIDGRTPLYILIRVLREYKHWSLSIFKRDNFTCVHCGDNKGGNLQADHIKPFCILMDEFLNKYKELSPINNKKELCKLAETYIPFWDINNGRTLCESCHKSTDTYGAKRARKKFKFKNKITL